MREVLDTGATLPLVEAFHTLQGEGAHTGRAVWFIRLAGCDVGCPWCDARDTWNRVRHAPVAVTEIVREASANPTRTAVVTGGEPLMHPLDALTEGLHDAGMRVHLETSGTHSFSGSFDWVCLSPKPQRPPLDEAWARADELKVIVAGEDDLGLAAEWASRVGEECLLFLQPEWSRRAAMTPLVVEFVKENPRWRVSLQTHKYMDIP